MIERTNCTNTLMRRRLSSESSQRRARSRRILRRELIIIWKRPSQYSACSIETCWLTSLSWNPITMWQRCDIKFKVVSSFSHPEVHRTTTEKQDKQSATNCVELNALNSSSSWSSCPLKVEPKLNFTQSLCPYLGLDYLRPVSLAWMRAEVTQNGCYRWKS